MSPPDRPSPTGDDTLASVLDPGRSPYGDLTGTTLGDFQVERLLGRGGMGDVYLATQVSLNRPVALKVLRPEVLAKPGYRERFASEAIAVAKLNHPSIVHVYAMGQVEGVHFIAMEYVEGTTLRDYIVKKGAMDLPQALAVLKQAAQAIGAAGEAGIIHRDVKPENILITRRGRVKVADFGLCRQVDDEGPQLTAVGITMGTPAYMSPEQAQGHPLDHRSDLYSLGATAYFMIAGIQPFRADSPVALALKQVRELPSSLLVHRPDCPLETDRLVMKLMAKDPADRYQSAAELLADLAKVRDQLQVAPGAGSGTTQVFDGSTARTEELGTMTGHAVPAMKGREKAPVAAAPARPAPATAAGGPVGAVEGAGLAIPRARFSGLVATAAAAIGLGAGALAGWAARAPEVGALPDVAAQRPPALWIEPRWSAIPKKEGAGAQYRYAQYAAPRDEWAAAWLAVPGFHPRSHDEASRAYIQLARLWYRCDDVEALADLGSGLSAWKQSQKRDKDLAGLIRLALDLKKGDLGAVEKGFARLADGEVAEMYDASLVSFGLEVCADALKAVQQKPGSQAIEEPLRRALRRLVAHLNKIEIGGAAGSGPRAAAAPRSGG